MKKIDMHIHLKAKREIGRTVTNTTFCLPDEILKMYKDLSIDKGVILPVVNPECSFGCQSIEEIIGIVDSYPGKFHWFCNIDPRAMTNSSTSDFSYMLQYYKDLGAKGLGEICSNLYFDSPLVDNLFKHCQKNNMPVVFHIAPKIGGYYGLADELGLPRLEKMLIKYPQLKFLGHSQPFWAEISSDLIQENRNSYPEGKVKPGRIIELMRKYDNLYGDMSAGSGFNAVSRDTEFGYQFLHEFKDRLLFATDICAPEEKIGLSQWLDKAVENKKISSNVYSRIVYENAKELLEI